MHKHPLLRSFVAGVAPALLLVSTVLAAPLPGAIFTRDNTGTQVNGNIYTDKSTVFLDGGPQNANCTAAGLTNGDYYFQVTDPSGATLLSSDDIVTQRKVTVLGGIITGYVATGTHTTFNNTNISLCGGIAVGLAPFDNTPNAGGEYKTWMTPVGDYDGTNLSGFYGFKASQSKTDNFKVLASPSTTSAITGVKFYDTNANRKQDPGEPGIAGWHIEKLPGAPDVAYTDSSCQYLYLATNDGTTYTIPEFPPLGWFPVGVWQNTTPLSGPATADAAAVLGPNFGNVCLGAGGGLTLGFWSNKNGQALIGPGDLAMLSALNLRNANGTDFNPTTNSGFRTWILNATATNMAYMLSAQLAAMELNVYNASGGVKAGSLIYAPGTASATAYGSSGLATVGAVMAEANTELGLHGSTLSGSAYRSYQEVLKTVRPISLR
jgi:hypothetical protein